MATSPSGATPNYGLNKYASGARGIADGLNSNWDVIDAAIKARANDIATTNTALTALTGRVSTLEGEGGTVDLSSAQDISGVKNFTNGMKTSNITLGVGSSQSFPGGIANSISIPFSGFINPIAVTGGGGIIVKGITGGTDGIKIIIVCTGPGSITFVNNDSGGNLLCGSGNVVVASGGLIEFVYYNTKWYKV